MFSYDALRLATSHAARASAAGRVGTRPFAGEATIDVRRVGTMWSRRSNQKKLYPRPSEPPGDVCRRPGALSWSRRSAPRRSTAAASSAV